MTNNKKVNVRANISPRNSGFYTQIINLLKPPLLNGHLLGDAMPI